MDGDRLDHTKTEFMCCLTIKLTLTWVEVHCGGVPSTLPDNTRPDLLITLGVLIFMGIKQVLIVVIRFVFTLWLLTVVMYIPRGSRLSQHDIKCIRQLDVVLPVVACLQC